MAYGAALTMAGKLLPYLSKMSTSPLATSAATGVVVKYRGNPFSMAFSFDISFISNSLNKKGG